MDEERSSADGREPAPGAAPTLTWRRKLAIGAVLAASVWHIGAIVAWMGPPSFVRDRVVRLTSRYVRVTKSDQYWGMFAPEPLAINRRLIARAEFAGDVDRELDLTTPVNRAMRSFTLERVGKKLKAHDRILGGDEPQYNRGFALHLCDELAARWGKRPAKVMLLRDFEAITVDGRSFKTNFTRTERATIGTYACVD